MGKSKKTDLMEKLLAQSELTERDAETIGHKIKHSIAKKHKLKTHNNEMPTL